MTLLSQITSDLELTGLSGSDEAYLGRKLDSILAAIKRVTGRDIEPKTWIETHAPTSSGMIVVANPPIRDMASAFTDYERDTGIVYTGTRADVTVEYEGGYTVPPADMYDAILSLMGIAWSQRNGGGMAATPGVKSMTVFDVGSVEFSDGAADAVLGTYDDIFRAYAVAASLIGVSTLKSAEEQAVVPPDIDVSGLEPVAFAYGDATPKLIGTVSAGLTVVSVAIDVQVPFDGVGAALSVGTTASPERFMAAADNAPDMVATFEVAPFDDAVVATDVYLFITPGSGASAGGGVVMIGAR